MELPFLASHPLVIWVQAEGQSFGFLVMENQFALRRQNQKQSTVCRNSCRPPKKLAPPRRIRTYDLRIKIRCSIQLS